MDKIQQLTNSLNIGERIDSAIITSNHNRKYFTNFSSSLGYILVTKDVSYLLVDFRYIEAAKKTCHNCEVVLFNRLDETLANLIKRHNLKSTLLESDSITLTCANSLKMILENNNVKAHLNRDLDKIINKIRMIKSTEEINKMRISQEITEKAFNNTLNKIRPGITESEISLDLEFQMKKLGAERVAFDLIVVSGKNSSLPHGVPSNKPIEKGDFVTIDMGAVYEGYRSDMTRTVAVSNVSDEQKHIYNIVLDAQMKAIESIKPGIICSEIDKIARDIIYSSGYEGYFGHSTGHSIGIEEHENPSFSRSCRSILEPGMIMTVEPGIYLPNKFGVRIEDMIFVNESGYENLTTIDKQLIVL